MRRYYDYVFLDGSEPIRSQFLFHVSPQPLKGNFFLTRQGIHLSTTIEASKELAKLRKYTNPHYYAVKLATKPKHSLRIEADPLDWGANTIARLLLARLDKKPFEGATKGFEETDDPEFPKSNYKMNNSPSLIHIDNLTPLDRNFLFNYANLKPEKCGEREFKVMAKFLESKGYNSIVYENYGETTQGDRCFIIFHPEWVSYYSEISIFTTGKRVTSAERNKIYFNLEVDKFINKSMQNLNSFLSDYGFTAEYVKSYFTDNPEHIDGWVGAFCSDLQSDLRIIPIALNTSILYNWANGNKKDNKLDWWNIKNEIDKTLAHEAAHGIYQYLSDFYELDDEEEMTETFAEYYVGEAGDSKLIDVLEDNSSVED